MRKLNGYQLMSSNLRAPNIVALLLYLGSTTTNHGGSPPVRSAIKPLLRMEINIDTPVDVHAQRLNQNCRLSLIGTDGTASAEFVLFGRVARQIIGKHVVALIRSTNKIQIGSDNDHEHILPEIAALVSQKFTFSVSVTQKSLTQRKFSFQVKGVVALYGKQSYIPRSSDPFPGTSKHIESAGTQKQLQRIDDDEAPSQKKVRLTRMFAIQARRTWLWNTKTNSQDKDQSEIPEDIIGKAGSSQQIVKLIPSATQRTENAELADNGGCAPAIGNAEQSSSTAQPSLNQSSGTSRKKHSA